MAESTHQGHLGAVYASKNPEEISSHYDNWAETYDSDMSIAGYRHPSICLALLTRHLPSGASPLLDAGAGTGLIGEWLNILGYRTVEALDISAGMLAMAREKGVYQALHQMALGNELPFEDNKFAGIVSAGVFTTGHVGGEGLDELVRICQSGGVIVLTAKKSLLDTDIALKISQLETQGLVSVAEQTEPYVSMPGEAGTEPSCGIVLKVR
jgi:predicted TPR repeat methyltransferase